MEVVVKRVGDQIPPYIQDLQNLFNSFTRYGKNQRKGKVTYRTKNANNFVKCMMLRKYTEKKSRILDLGCGRGQDVQKHIILRPAQVVFADIADVALQEAIHRWRHEKRPYPAAFVQYDFCGTVPLDMGLFDVVSCQFAVHYACRSEESLLRFFSNVAACLSEKGTLMLSMPNSNVLLDFVALSVYNPDRGVYVFDNGLIHLEFATTQLVHGTPYVFQMLETLNCTQYVAELPVIESVARQFGIRLVHTDTFEQSLKRTDRSPTIQGLARRMGILQDTMLMTPQEWEIVRLYRLCIFQRSQ